MRLTQASSYRLLIIRSGKAASFAHGPSPALLCKWTRDEFLAWAEQGQKLCGKLAHLSIPSVAVIAGNCCDAGLELALACDYRVVVNQPETSLGFPELEWGMIPCWGSTQRLPRLIGLENSLPMLLTGAKLDAAEANRCGLADEICEIDDEAPPAFLANPVKRDWSRFRRRSWRELYVESNRLGRWFLFRGAERIVDTRIPNEMPAPAEMLEALRFACQAPSVEAGMTHERKALARLVDHPALGHLTRLLHQRQRLRSAPEEPSSIRHVGVIGGGVTGLSLFLQCLAAGYEVVLKTHDETALGVALAQIVQLLQAEVQQKSMTQELYQKILKNIRGTYTWTHFATLDLILDTTIGGMDEKNLYYIEAEKLISPSTLLIPINPPQRVYDLGDELQEWERFTTVHLAEPWSRGSLAEIVVTSDLSPENFTLLRGWLVSMGRSCWAVPDCGYSVAMRIWLPALNEAAVLLEECVSIEDIDRAMRRFGMTHGPLEWMDSLGLDHVAELMSTMQPIFGERLEFDPGFIGMVGRQWLGKASGDGFYRHGAGRPRPNREAERLWRQTDRAPVLSQADLHTWIERRLVMLTVLEAVRCLEEKVATNADELDCALCLTGWATHRGGPIGYARQLGVERVTAICTELEHEHGPRFATLAALGEWLSRN